MKNLKFYTFLIFNFVLIPLFSQNHYDILINEFMANPTGANGLPNAEYIELYNRSVKTINLKGWYIQNGSKRDTITEGYILEPKQYVVLHNGVLDFKALGYTNSIATKKWATLNNTKDDFILKNDKGIAIDAILYNTSFYRNDTLAKGGYSLERVFPPSPCQTTEWTASKSPKGGTIGTENAAKNLIFDIYPFEITNAYFENDKTVILKSNRILHRDSLENTYHFSINNGLKVSSVTSAEKIFFKDIQVKFDKEFKTNEIYQLGIKNTIKNCIGELLLNKDTTLVLRKNETKIDKDSLIINEILLNPEPNGSRFIELYNRSKTKTYDIQSLIIIDSIKNNRESVLSNFLVFPENYIVLADNTTDIINRYAVSKYRNKIIQNKLPAWAETAGLIKLESNNITLDSLRYDKTYHSPLLANTEGVSLERIFTDKPTNDKNNWQSASKNSKYATPAYRNSQANTPSVSGVKNDAFFVEKTTFSPYYDDRDYILIHYKLDKTGYYANINIHDAQGRFIKNVVQNEALQAEGYIKWEGDTAEQGNKAPSGLYIIYAELYSSNGLAQKWKQLIYLIH